MKKLLFITMIAFVGISSVNAQKESGFELGGNTGLNISVVTNANGVGSVENYTSFNLGLSGEYYFSDHWGLKTKLILDNKGWGNGTFVPVQGGNITTSNIILTYLVVPVMANWHFGSKRKWYLQFGLYTGFLLSADSESNSIDVSNSIQNIDLGFTAGIGYKFSIAEKTNMFIEYDRQEGVTDVFKQSIEYAVRNSRSSFNIGVLFDLD